MKTNISSLYLTAKTELARKDKIIADLRTELEDLKFRRVGKRNFHYNGEHNRPAKIAKVESEADVKKETHEHSDCNVGNLREATTFVNGPDFSKNDANKR